MCVIIILYIYVYVYIVCLVYIGDIVLLVYVDCRIDRIVIVSVAPLYKHVCICWMFIVYIVEVGLLFHAGVLHISQFYCTICHLIYKRV